MDAATETTNRERQTAARSELTNRTARWSRLLLRAAAVVAAWGLAVSITGGFVIEYGPLRLSSRNSRNSFLIAIIISIIAIGLASTEDRRRWFSPVRRVFERGADWINALSRLSGWVAAALALGFAVFGMRAGSIDAGGSDVLGYVSQAELWLAGSLRVDQPLVHELRWTNTIEALTPLGYKPGYDGVSSVPAYPPGLPLTMAAFQWVGGRDAVYLVVPLLGGLLVWSAYKLGTEIGGSGVGLATAALTATAPAVIFQLMLPMSDVPVAAWWALALWLLLVERPLVAFAAGIAAGLAVLTRPNHVFYVPIPAAYLLWLTLRERTLTGSPARRLLAFVAGVVPACLAVAAIDAWVYGSPLASGNGRLSEFYSVSTVIPNLGHYLSWMTESNTPAFFAALFAPFLTTVAMRVNHRAVSKATVVMLLAFGVAVLASYLIFFVFEDWWYLRYLLAAYPPLFALTSLTSLTVLRRFVPRYAAAVMIVIVLLLAWHGFYYARARGAFAFRAGEHKYSAVGNYVARKFPKNAVFICMQYSGSLRYYSGHTTIRWDWIEPRELDRVIADLERLNYKPYILLEQDEAGAFRKRYAGASRIAGLDWRPVAILQHSSPARIYDPHDAANPDAPLRQIEIFY